MMIGGSRFLRYQVTSFVILFVERAGSTYLITALKDHPQILALGEQLAVMRQEGKGGPEQVEWARQFLKPPLVGHHAAIGFKTKLVDIFDRSGFSAVLQERRCRIIQLQRRNSVKAVVSTLNAHRQWQVSGNWNLLNESTRLAGFTVDPERFATLLAEREELDRDLREYVGSLRLPTLAMHYEDLLQNEPAFLGQALEFLGATAPPVPGKTLKNTSDDLRQVVQNFDQLRARYAGTQYEAMFDEVLTPA